MLPTVPDTVRNAATAEEAARALVVALRLAGGDDVQLWEPDWDKEQTGEGLWRVVCEGSGNPDWGVIFSLAPGFDRCRWGHMECYWGFDVSFVPREQEG